MSRWAAIMQQIKPAKTEISSINVFVYGLPGSGKTYFAGTASKSKKTLLIKAEEGAMTIRGTDTMVVPLVSPESPLGVKERMSGLLSFLKSEEGQEAFEVVAIDTISAAQTQLVREIRQKKRGKALSMQEWGAVVDWTVDTLAAIAALPQSTIVLCHSKEIEETDTGSVLVRPSLSGKKLPNSATAEFDIAVYATRHEKDDDVSYVMLTSHSGEKYTVKDRTGRLDRVEVNDFSVWLEKINEGDTEE